MTILLVPLGIACLIWGFRGRRGYTGEPKCAACGYLVVGLPSAICPECGADLAAPGAVVRAGNPQPRGMLAKLAGWSAFCLLAVYVACEFIWWNQIVLLVPLEQNISGNAALSMPYSHAYAGFDIKWRGHRYASASSSGGGADTITILLLLGGQRQRKMDVDGKTLAYEYRDSFGAKNSSGPLTADALLEWLGQAGVDVGSSQVQREMGPVMDAVRIASGQATGITLNSTFGSMSQSSGTTSGRGNWVLYVPREVAGGIWVVGIGWLLVRRGAARTVGAASTS